MTTSAKNSTMLCNT